MSCKGGQLAHLFAVGRPKCWGRRECWGRRKLQGRRECWGTGAHDNSLSVTLKLACHPPSPSFTGLQGIETTHSESLQSAASHNGSMLGPSSNYSAGARGSSTGQVREHEGGGGMRAHPLLIQKRRGAAIQGRCVSTR